MCRLIICLISSIILLSMIGGLSHYLALYTYSLAVVCQQHASNLRMMTTDDGLTLGKALSLVDITTLIQILLVFFSHWLRLMNIEKVRRGSSGFRSTLEKNADASNCDTTCNIHSPPQATGSISSSNICPYQWIHSELRICITSLR